MNGASHDMWNHMKALGQELKECQKAMEDIVAQFHVDADEGDEDVDNAMAGINDAVVSWWSLCDRYYMGDFVEEKYWERMKDYVLSERKHNEEVEKKREAKNGR